MIREFAGLTVLFALFISMLSLWHHVLVSL